MEMRLANKVAIITGGGSGIGRAMSILFAKEDAKVVVADITDSGGEETIRLIKADGGDAIFVHTDVTKAADIERLIKTTIETFSKLDILCNNAGVPQRSTPLEAIEEAEWDHIYSVMLLGHFREPKAHKIIIDLFSLPGRLSDDLFGDIITENLPTILMRTCDGSLERIKSMALNKEADDFCRTSALHAMAYAVIEGIATREEVLSFYDSLFTGHEADEDSEFWGLLACLVNDLYPEELMETIKIGYEDGLINPGMINYRAFDRSLERGKEKCLEDLKKDFEYRSLGDVHKSMSWWSCFDENNRDSLPPYIPFSEPVHNIEKDNQKKKKAKKIKRKMIKASKRKNRR